jgi:REP element-mobilizing transposase RayT
MCVAPERLPVIRTRTFLVMSQQFGPEATWTRSYLVECVDYLKAVYIVQTSIEHHAAEPI